jgi:hypothetical protein
MGSSCRGGLGLGPTGSKNGVSISLPLLSPRNYSQSLNRVEERDPLNFLMQIVFLTEMYNSASYALMEAA